MTRFIGFRIALKECLKCASGWCLKVLQPYTFQADDIEKIRELFRKYILAVLWYLPTGAGKSFAAAFMILAASQSRKICWFIVHRRELLRQVEKQFKDLGIDYGVV